MDALEGCTCQHDARRAGHDLAWFCWMFGCDVCVEAHHICGSLTNVR